MRFLIETWIGNTWTKAQSAIFFLFEKMSGVRILTTFISVKTITDRFLLSLQKRSRDGVTSQAWFSKDWTVVRKARAVLMTQRMVGIYVR